ncbi:hypothetical protein P4U43_04025 [Arthrobacter sp. EH-1B-1]|uniref:Uncharacterized protein n=1 Tax=Arthrobacter vasquezii TaxID=2977629 RepID=A0ABT6CTX0_9MICC|nr:hypothetical protein [Arthrobacter vasquezii]MDF9276957.1 hypothetical protein [Arthrobacter vasquezii]
MGQGTRRVPYPALAGLALMGGAVVSGAFGQGADVRELRDQLGRR